MKPKYTGLKYLLCIIPITFFQVACHKPMSNSDLKSVMQTYDRLILKTDADSIALLYTVDGDLGNAVHGRDSIRNFLNRFKEYKVLEQVSKIDSINITGDTGRISGTFHQRTIIPIHDTLNPGRIQDTISVNGTFHSVWINISEYGWEIRKFETNTGK
jgi:hypothetical protein